ncbi:hypothetical protein BGZ80_011143 [Entomortierella chlamydospora]|uniref:Uncharacterized protein n=1 Tax=Entomortierella chlamydospora TaxID=101097 RepID=A0A9P6N3Z5_9FUNG|nr:hypothetical protein BGZ79_002949 [Entomortierella chlamydospora]KAG0022794.1 hypothetical protein BGZ80_011143 [Entomortierella chlamydospora]
MKTTPFISCVLFAATALISIIIPISAHIAISNPPGQGGPWSDNPTNKVHAWIGYEGKPFPCGGYKPGPVTTYKAGDIIPVRFWNFGIKDYKKFPPPAGVAQARHGGGACEFSLSYDGGKSWKVIGQYTKTCPDIYYEWPVMIPKNAPSCTDSNKCLFAMSWVAWATDQFYHHCANVVIQGVAGGKLPTLGMTVVDVAQLGNKIDTHANGDMSPRKSTGPDRREKDLNTNGYFANGGAAGNHGLDLGLVVKPKK